MLSPFSKVDTISRGFNEMSVMYFGQNNAETQEKGTFPYGVAFESGHAALSDALKRYKKLGKIKKKKKSGS